MGDIYSGFNPEDMGAELAARVRVNKENTHEFYCGKTRTQGIIQISHPAKEICPYCGNEKPHCNFTIKKA